MGQIDNHIYIYIASLFENQLAGNVDTRRPTLSTLDWDLSALQFGNAGARRKWALGRADPTQGPSIFFIHAFTRLYIVRPSFGLHRDISVDHPLTSSRFIQGTHMPMVSPSPSLSPSALKLSFALPSASHASPHSSMHPSFFRGITKTQTQLYQHLAARR